MAAHSSCPACRGKDLQEIFHLPSIPVQSCILLNTESEARNFKRAPLTLLFCDTCGLIFNAVFEPAFVDYAQATEESQHFSSTFNGFAQQLAREIAERTDLAGKTTLEIGCGKGEFLVELAAQTGTIGVGIDPGFIPERLDTGGLEDKISFRREYFDPARVTIGPDYIVCRHTLEHISDLHQFMSGIAKVIGKKTDVGIFFETPDVRRVLEEGAFWDIYYEHCSYFTLGSHARLFRQFGMDVTELYLAYADQYIIQYATSGGAGQPTGNEQDLEALRDLARSFPKKVEETRSYWTEFVRSHQSAGKNVAIWGGGSKGVSFLTTNELEEKVESVVDINPVKQGKYMPGTGRMVLAPEDLQKNPPDTVIVMNPIYLPEIKVKLQSLGLSPEVRAV